MILVDTPVWVDYFNGTQTTQADILDAILAQQIIVIGDLVYIEVLQGFSSD
jgi:predicted nucleic acid-binding protein